MHIEFFWVCGCVKIFMSFKKVFTGTDTVETIFNAFEAPYVATDTKTASVCSPKNLLKLFRLTALKTCDSSIRPYSFINFIGSLFNFFKVDFA